MNDIVCKEVVPGLFIGNKEAEKSLATLVRATKHGITHILQARLTL